MVTERRQSPRAKPNEPVYVSLAKQNRGIVIDASEDGLQFWTDAPVQSGDGALPLRFMVNPFDEIEMLGEIVWLDESNKTGGLRFKNLPEPERSKIRKWLEQSARLLPPRADATDVQTVSREAEAFKEIESEPVAAPGDGPAGATIAAPAPSDSSRAGTYALTSEFAVPWRPSLTARPAASHTREKTGRRATLRSQTDVSRRVTRRVVLMMLGFAFVVIVGLGLIFHWRIGGGTQSVGADLFNWNWAGSQPDAQRSPAASEISPLLRPPSKTHRIRPIVVGRDAASPSTNNAGETELATAWQDLSGDGGQAETNAAVKWLWAAVQKGNAKAAILLADLYVWGRGVPQNCAQARVLLVAASKRGSTEAAQQLQDMEADGCGSTEAPSK